LNNSQLSPIAVKQLLFLLLLGIIGYLLFTYLQFFLSGLLGSLVVYILLRPAYFYFTEKKNINSTLVVVILFLISAIILLMPVWLLTVMLSSKASLAIANYENVLQAIKQWLQQVTNYTGFDILSQESISKLTSTAANIVPKILSATLNSLAQVGIMYFVLYFMLSNARKFEAWAKTFSPFNEKATGTLLKELKSMTVSNSIGIPILAIIQTLFAGLGYWILGVNEPFIWAVVTGVASVVPVVGTTIVWIPLCIYLYVIGHPIKASILLGYGALIITNVDNVFRFVVQRKIGDVHPLITFFGVILGIDLFGFTGIIFGPLLISYFLILLRLYKAEYGTKQ
jgi:predicted PurR-regulated permease PerM